MYITLLYNSRNQLFGQKLSKLHTFFKLGHYYYYKTVAIDWSVL